MELDDPDIIIKMTKYTEQKVVSKGVMGLALMLSVVLFVSYVSAFGIGSAYHKDRPLELSIGETKEIRFNLQNGPGPDDITAKPSIGKGSEVMELVDTGNVFVPVGGSVDVLAKVSVPNNAKIGDVYSVEIVFNTVSDGSESGTFGLGSSVGKSFDVVVVPTIEERASLVEQKLTRFWVASLVTLVVILLILLIQFKSRKRKK